MITRAKDVAELELATMSGRLAHVRGVAATAAKVASSLLRDQHDEVIAAAWLHDVGYGPRVRNSGFHPLDGAAFLVSEGFHDVVSSLVAFYSSASEEAEERGLTESLSQFTPPPNDLARQSNFTFGPFLGLDASAHIDSMTVVNRVDPRPAISAR